ncbi:hypothetical protein QCA50_014569 [Cerrena zonata]|uniref:AB hydrolase-1 domain-containing protein n=1 Tax=Cerrena zonata TaxID=2478898 RepID=A0AAW0FS28_9APHY
MTRPGHADVQLDLFFDYQTNLALYPKFQEYFRAHQPPTLAVWGKNDQIFIPPGAEAYRRDIPNAKIVFVDSGHFAIETHLEVIADEILSFLGGLLTSRLE